MYVLSSSLNMIQIVIKYNCRVYYLVVLPSVEFITPHLELKLFLDSGIVKYRGQTSISCSFSVVDLKF